MRYTMKEFLNVNSLYHDLNTVHPLAGASILHLQGCRKGRTNPCPGCANEDLWVDEEKWLVGPDHLAEILTSHAATPALSISGGEPLDQYGPLCQFLQALRKVDFSVLMYTGFEFGRVKIEFGSVLDLVDYIVTGLYRAGSRVQTVPFIASSNQEIHCLNGPAKKALASYNRVGEHEVVINKGDPDVVWLGSDIG
jgi:organic radical activating enzyme